MVQHIMSGLGEDLDDPKALVLLGKLLRELGCQIVWETFVEAQCTSLLKKDGSKRSPGGTFFTLLKKHKQHHKLRQVAYWSK